MLFLGSVNEILKCLKYDQSCLTDNMLKMEVLTFESVEEIRSNVTIQMRATQQYFYVVLFIVLSEVLLTLKSVKATINGNTFPGADPHSFPPFYRNL